MPTLQEHYADPGFASRMWTAIEAAGLDRHHLTTDEIRPLDEFHLRGRAASMELLELAAFMPNEHILDVGSGIGGPARFIASTTGARVTGVDLTPEFCDFANELTAATKLDHQVRFHSADALNLPFEDDTFDGAWMQHVNMNIGDKGALFHELNRVVRPGGRLALHEVVEGEGQPYFPAPWASDIEHSHLVTADTLRACWESAGFETREMKDDTMATRAWIEAMAERSRVPGPPPILGLNLLMGEKFTECFGNVARGVLEGKLRVIMALVIKK